MLTTGRRRQQGGKISNPGTCLRELDGTTNQVGTCTPHRNQIGKGKDFTDQFSLNIKSPKKCFAIFDETRSTDYRHRQGTQQLLKNPE